MMFTSFRQSYKANKSGHDNMPLSIKIEKSPRKIRLFQGQNELRFILDKGAFKLKRDDLGQNTESYSRVKFGISLSRTILVLWEHLACPHKGKSTFSDFTKTADLYKKKIL